MMVLLEKAVPFNTTINVNLSGDLYKFVKAAVNSGRYTSASEVVRDALRGKRDQALSEVERKIEAGLESARRGESFDGAIVMRELRGLGAKQRSGGNARDGFPFAGAVSRKRS